MSERYFVWGVLMVVGPDFSTSVQEQDFDEVDHLLRVAYQSDAPVHVLRQLRADGDIWYESKTPWMGKIGGYYAIARMQAPADWACLALLAVRPEYQRGALAERNPNMVVGGPKDEQYRGPWRFGKRMVQGLASYYDFPSFAPKLPIAIVAFGLPEFFQRYCWSLERARHLRSEHPLDQIALLRSGEDVPMETLVFPQALAGL